jgi:uncharacterized protein (DUF885 family)
VAVPGGGDPTTVGEVADAYVESFASLDPLAATRLGIAGHESGMTDFGPDGVAERAQLARSGRKAVLAARADGEGDRIAAAVMAERLSAELDAYEAGEWCRDLNVLFSPLQNMRESFDLMALDTVDDVEAMATRMAGVPTALSGMRASLSEGLATGMPAARRQALACARQARAVAGGTPGGDGYFSRLARRAVPLVAAGVAERVGRLAAAGDAALGEHAEWLERDYAPFAAEADGVGAERYALLARNWNGVELDLEATSEWGWEELRRIEGEMERVAASILPGEPMSAVRDLLETDPARAIEGGPGLRAWLQRLMDEALDELDGVHFDLPAPVRHLEACLAPPGGAAAPYYTGPSEDFARPGRTWYPTQGRTRFPLWREVSVAYHEGVPGHHLQVAVTQYRRDRLNRYQRTMAHTAGHGEGWALYAERLMGELGYLDNPDYLLGMLSGQATRAVRVVVDIGLHLGLRIPADERFHPGERWTPELACALMVQRAGQPAPYVASEVDRYLGMPGQAISYKVGERVWLEGREAARRRAGAVFDLKSFHARALDLGPMGLADLAELLPTC